MQTNDSIKTALLEQLKKIRDEQEAKYKTSPQPPRQSKTLADMNYPCEELASYTMSLTKDHKLPLDEAITIQLEKLRRLIATKDEDFASSANTLLETISIDIARFAVSHVLAFNPDPIIDQTFLNAVALSEVKAVHASAEKKAKMIWDAITVPGIADKVILMRNYLSILSKFLEQPNTSNQIILRMLLAMVQSISTVLVDIYVKM